MSGPTQDEIQKAFTDNIKKMDAAVAVRRDEVKAREKACDKREKELDDREAEMDSLQKRIDRLNLVTLQKEDERDNLKDMRLALEQAFSERDEERQKQHAESMAELQKLREQTTSRLGQLESEIMKYRDAERELTLARLRLEEKG